MAMNGVGNGAEFEWISGVEEFCFFFCFFFLFIFDDERFKNAIDTIRIALEFHCWHLI